MKDSCCCVFLTFFFNRGPRNSTSKASSGSSAASYLIDVNWFSDLVSTLTQRPECAQDTRLVKWTFNWCNELKMTQYLNENYIFSTEMYSLIFKGKSHE